MDSIQDVFTMGVVNPVEIKSLFFSNTPSELNIYLTLSSIRPNQADVVFSILNEKDNVIKTKTASVDVDGDELIVKTIPLDDVMAGHYSIVVGIGGTNIENSKEFSIETIKDVQKTTAIEEGVFGKLITVTVTNNGNVMEYDYQIYEEASGVTGLVIRPNECYDAGGEKTACASSISTLSPGETVTIKYSIQFWPTYAAWVVVIVVILALLGFSFMKVTAPKIKKRHISSKSGVHTVALEIKNPKKNLTNVIVRDWVSPLAKVVQKEAKSLRPIIRRTEAGTELIWKLGDFIGKEERVITYKLKSMVEGELKMPRAYLRFRDDSGRGSRVFSKGVVIS